MKDNEQINIKPLRMIRIAKDLTMEEMGEYFLVTKAYISALEKGNRSINFRTLRFGLNNLNISLEDYNTLEEFSETLLNDELSNRDRYKFMLIKTLGVVDTELKEETEELLDKYYYSKKRGNAKNI